MLKLSSSRKVAPIADRYKGAKVQNCFSLPPSREGSCPGATTICEAYCYAARDAKYYKSVNALYWHNFNLLKECGRSVAKMTELLNDVILKFKRQFERKNLTKVFRIHESGDFFSLTYARAWANVIRAHPDVQFWAYTRSFTPKLNVVPILQGIENLTLYVSVDPMNYRIAAQQTKEWEKSGVLIAHTVGREDVQESVVKLTGRKAPVCPEVIGNVPLVNDEGVGACISCGMCIEGKNKGVIFPVKHHSMRNYLTIQSKRSKVLA